MLSFGVVLVYIGGFEQINIMGSGIRLSRFPFIFPSEGENDKQPDCNLVTLPK